MAWPGIYLYNSDMQETGIRVRLNSCGRMRCSPDWSWDTAPGLADFDLITIHRGRGRYRWDEEVFEARAGSCLLLRPGQRYLGSLDPDDPLDVTWVHFDYLGVSGAVEHPEPQRIPVLYRMLENTGFFFELLERLLWAFRSSSASGAALWLSGALSELVRQDARPRWHGAELEQSCLIEELCTHIRREPGVRWRVSEMARRAYVTPDHFGRLFRKFARVTPGEFIVRARIDAAMGLLRSSSHSVTRIAELLGYLDVYAFSRQFKQKTGMAPTEYRKGD